MNMAQRPHTKGSKNLQNRRSKMTMVYAIQVLPNQSYRICAVRQHNGLIQSIQRIDSLSPDNATKVIQDLKYRRGADTILVIPRHLAVVKFIRVPSIEPQQIDDMILHEIRPITPWPEEEGVWGYTIEHLGEDGYAHILVVMVRKAVLQQHYDELKSMGIELTHITLSTLALQSLLERTEDNERPAIMHVADGTTEYIRLSQNRIAFTRGVNSNTPPSLMFQQSTELDLRKNGDASHYTSLVAINETDDSTFTTHLDNSEAGHTCSVDRNFSVLLNQENVSNSDMLCAGAFLRVSTSSPTENLLPDTVKKTLRLRHFLQTVKWFALSLAWLVSVVVAIGWFDVHTQRILIESTQAEIQQLKQEVGDLDIQSRDLAQLSSQFSSVSAPLTILLELYEITPNKIAINYFRYADSGTIVIGGEAPSMDDVISYIGILQKSETFLDVSSNNISKPNTGTSSLVDFKLSCIVAKR
jgi:Fimbrial assembly protein (PilN)